MRMNFSKAQIGLTHHRHSCGKTPSAGSGSFNVSGCGGNRTRCQNLNQVRAIASIAMQVADHPLRPD